MSTSTAVVQHLRSQLKALTFDIFGTVVDWRSTVVETLVARAQDKIASPQFEEAVPEEVRLRVAELRDVDWAAFAQEWRNAYGVFCVTFIPGVTQWKDIDTHHHDSLVELLEKWQLSGLYEPDEIRELSLVWHRLRPWDDSSQGIKNLGNRYITATLSNGNPELLKDLDGFGDLGFRRVISAADFKAYKPNPKVYLGAVSALGYEPGEVAMVAAHLSDLWAARACGLRTVYIERPGEENWKPTDERYREAKRYVDIWISEGEGGLLQVSELLGGAS